MPANYSLAVKTKRMAVVLAAIDAAATPGRVVIRDTINNNDLVRIPLDHPSLGIGRASFIQDGATLTMNATPRSAPPDHTGNAMTARIEDGDGNLVCEGLTVGTAAASDIVLTSSIISMGESVRINQGTITHG